MRYAFPGIIALLYFLPLSSFCQDQQTASTDPSAMADKIVNFPSKFFAKVQSNAAKLDQQITKQTQKYLQRLAKKEDQLRKKMFQQDSVSAQRIFGSNPLNYQALLQKLQTTGSQAPGVATTTGGVYMPYLDSLKTSLKFFQQNQNLLANSARWQGQIGTSLAQVNQLQNKMQLTQQIQQLITLHQQQLRQSLSQYTNLPPGLQNSYQGYSQEAYYYKTQLKSYADALSDPDQLTKKALGILNQNTAFPTFMKSHSDLSSLFSPPSIGSSGAPKALAGLQTRSVVQGQLHGQVAAGGADAQQAVQQKIQSAKARLQALQNKISQAGGGNSAMAVPDFRPNTQRTKTLWGRLQGGVNIQSLPSTYVFPATSSFGASLSYKLSDKNTIGIGGAYIMGWGSGIQHIAISSQGLGLRSFLETKIKGSFSLYGGFEYDYQQIITSFRQINSLSEWTPAGLLGVTKQYRISSKVKGELQLLWDFLSYSQVPKTSPILFRVGYSFQ